MTDYGHIGGAFEAMYRLAVAGLIAIVILAVLLLALAVGGGVWAWNHVTISVDDPPSASSIDGGSN